VKFPETLQSIRDRAFKRFEDRMLSYKSFREELIQMEKATLILLMQGHSKYSYMAPYFDMVKRATQQQELSLRYTEIEQEIQEIPT